MGDPARAVFHHVDLDDRFELYGNLVFVAIRCWGGAMFFLCLGGGVLMLLYFILPPLKFVLDRVPSEWAAGFWIGLSFPIAIYYTWRHWHRVHRNYFVVDASGIEYFNFPSRPKRIPWSEVRVVRDTVDPDDDDSSSELVFQTAQGKFTLGEGWPGGAIQAAIGKYFRITRRESKARQRP